MPYFSSNDPSAFGWSFPPARIVPFNYGGHDFPQGVDSRVSELFTRALIIICSQPGFRLHSGSGLNDGDWGYEDRNTVSGNSKSFHAYGLALDLNAPWNPYGSSVPDASPYRLPPRTSELIRPLGLLWGGGPEWGSRRDWMHIEVHLSPNEIAGAPAEPFPPRPFPLPAGWSFGPVRDAHTVSGTPPLPVPYRDGIVFLQGKLRTSPDGLYGPKTTQACRSYQSAHALQVDGLTGPRTWASLASS